MEIRRLTLVATAVLAVLIVGGSFWPGLVAARASDPAPARVPRAISPQEVGQPTAGPKVVLQAQEGDGSGPSYAPPPPPRPGIGSQAARIKVNYQGFTEEAKTAFQFAADIWAKQLTSPVTIEVNASYATLSPCVLGQAGPKQVFPVGNVWYPSAIANKKAGVDLDPTTADIDATFSSAFPTTCRGNFSGMYFGTEGKVPANQIDFVTVVLHELGHGLGFLGSADVAASVGSYGIFGAGGASPMIWDTFVIDGNGNRLTRQSNQSTSLGRYLTSDNLFFDGEKSKAANRGQSPKLYAPATWESGSSYSHLNDDSFPKGNPNALMTPKVKVEEAVHNPGPITLGMFQDMGWDIDDGTTPTPTRVPNTPTPITSILSPTPPTATATPRPPTATATPRPSTATTIPATATTTGGTATATVATGISTSTPTSSATVAVSRSVTATGTTAPATAVASSTATGTTVTATSSPGTVTPSPSGTVAASVTGTPSVSATPPVSATPDSTVSPTVTGTPEGNVTPIVSITPGSSATPGSSSTPDSSATPDGSTTATPTGSPSADPSVSPSATGSPVASGTAIASATSDPGVSVTPTHTSTHGGIAPQLVFIPLIGRVTSAGW